MANANVGVEIKVDSTRAVSSVERVIGSFRRMRSSASRMADTVTGATKRASMGLLGLSASAKTASSSLHGVGTSAYLAAGGLSALGVGTARAFGEIDASVRQLTAVESAAGANREELDRLYRSVTDLSKELSVQFPVSASEAADGMAQMVKGGMDSEVALKNAAAAMGIVTVTGMKAGPAMDMLTDVMNGFALSTGSAAEQSANFKEVGDIMAAVSSSTSTNLREMMGAMNEAAGISNNFGLSARETAVALGVLASTGIKGTQAGQRFRNMLLSGKKAAEKNKEIWDKNKIDPWEDGNFSARKFSDQMTNAIKGMTSKDAISFISSLGFEMRGADTAARLFGENAQAQFDRIGARAEGATGTIQKMADEIGGGFLARVMKTGNLIKSVFTDVFETLLPIFNPILEKVNSVFLYIKSLSPETKLLIGKMILLAGAVTAVAVAVGAIGLVAKFAAVGAVITAKVLPVLWLMGKAVKIFGERIKKYLGVESWEAVLTFFGALPAMMSASFTAMWDGLQAIMESFFIGLMNKWSEFKAWIKGETLTADDLIPNDLGKALDDIYQKRDKALLELGKVVGSEATAKDKEIAHTIDEKRSGIASSDDDEDDKKFSMPKLAGALSKGTAESFKVAQSRFDHTKNNEKTKEEVAKEQLDTQKKQLDTQKKQLKQAERESEHQVNLVGIDW